MSGHQLNDRLYLPWEEESYASRKFRFRRHNDWWKIRLLHSKFPDDVVRLVESRLTKHEIMRLPEYRLTSSIDPSKFYKLLLILSVAIDRMKFVNLRRKIVAKWKSGILEDKIWQSLFDQDFEAKDEFSCFLNTHEPGSIKHWSFMVCQRTLLAFVRNSNRFHDGFHVQRLQWSNFVGELGDEGPTRPLVDMSLLDKGVIFKFWENIRCNSFKADVVEFTDNVMDFGQANFHYSNEEDAIIMIASGFWTASHVWRLR
jgi:hypothetical protein